jgi:fucose 4-O-acetylase-like acetyltransferase
MPMFFFISGFLFNANKYPSFDVFAKKRFKRLVVPYLIYSIVTWGIWAIFRYFRHDVVKSYWMPLLQTFIAQGSGSYLVHNSALWFIPCLLAVEIMFFFISRLREGLKISVCFIMALVGVLLAHSLGDSYLFNMPWNLDAALLALPFYGTGNILRNKLKSFDTIISQKVISIGVSVILLFLLGYLSFNFGECSMGSSSYKCHEIIFFIRAFMGIFSLLTVCLLFSKSHLINNYFISQIKDSLKR